MTTDFDHIDRVSSVRGHDMGAHEGLRVEEILEDMTRRREAHAQRIPHEDGPRILSDSALDVRQVRPTGFLTGQSAVPGAVPVQVAYARRERLSLTIVNIGSATVYIGSTQATAQPTSGFPVPANSALTLSAMSDVWASCASGSSSTVGVLDEYRSESDGA